MHFYIESHNCAAFAVSQQLWDSNNWSWSNERAGWWLSQFPGFFFAIKRRRSSSHEKTHNLATETDPHSGYSEKELLRWSWKPLTFDGEARTYVHANILTYIHSCSTYKWNHGQLLSAVFCVGHDYMADKIRRLSLLCLSLSWSTD